MISNIFPNDLTDEGLALVFEYTVHQKFMQMTLPSDRLRELQMSNGHVITPSARLQDIDCKCCKIKVIVNQLILPVCTAGLVDGSQWANVCRYIAPVVKNGAENLTGEGTREGQARELLLPLGAATAVTLA